MNQTELKAYAEAKALEKYPEAGIIQWVDANITISRLNKFKQEAYAQAIIDNYKEPERVNEKLVEAVKELIQELDWAYADEDNSIRPAKRKVEKIIKETASLQLENEDGLD